MATTVPAWKAWTMNSYCVIIARSSSGFQLGGGAVLVTLSRTATSARMGMGNLALIQPDHKDPPTPVLDDVDGCRVDTAQRLAGDDLLRPTDCDSSVSDVDHQVQQREQGVHVVRHQDHRQALRPRHISD